MLTVHHLETSRSQRILWLLEELAVPYDIRLYRRDPVSRLAPAALKQIHPLGKSPVVTDDDTVVTESGAIIEYLVERFGAQAPAELAQLEPARGTPEHRECRFWMHYAEGSLMNWLVMKLVFDTIPRQPMPFFVRPAARALCTNVQQKLVNTNVQTALAFIDGHLAEHRWYARLWRAWTLRRMGLELPSDLVAAAKTDPAGDWPHPALALMAGIWTPEQMMAEVEKKSGDDRQMARAEAWFYLGQFHQIHGEAELAAAAFRKAREMGVTVYIEHMAAGFELQKMEAVSAR